MFTIIRDTCRDGILLTSHLCDSERVVFFICVLFTVPIFIDVKTGPGISKDLRVFLSCKKIILYKAGMNKREKERDRSGVSERVRQHGKAVHSPTVVSGVCIPRRDINV